jgi:predicted enzyme related to lactoylglutathione lyase
MASNLGYDGGLTCTIQCTDLARSIAFYRDKLGFKHLYTLDDIAWAELATEVKGVNIGLSQVEKITGTGNCKLTFGVKNVDHTRRQLEAVGVRFTEETIEIPGMVRLATFVDPDGNPHMFYQDLAKK